MSMNWPKREDFDVVAVRGLRLYRQRQHCWWDTEHGRRCVTQNPFPAVDYVYHIRLVITPMSYWIVSIIKGSRSNTPFQSCTMLEGVRLRCFQTLCSLLASVARAGFAAACSDDRTGRMTLVHRGERDSEMRRRG